MGHCRTFERSSIMKITIYILATLATFSLVCGGTNEELPACDFTEVYTCLANSKQLATDINISECVVAAAEVACFSDCSPRDTRSSNGYQHVVNHLSYLHNYDLCMEVNL